jgi:hypothetical protein
MSLSTPLRSRVFKGFFCRMPIFEDSARKPPSASRLRPQVLSLGRVVGTEGEEVSPLGDLTGRSAGPGQLYHGADLYTIVLSQDLLQLWPARQWPAPASGRTAAS